MKKIIFATGNKAKLAQIRFVIEHFKLQIEVVGVKDFFSNYTSYEEIGDSVEQVSLNGALAVAKMIGSPVITEDTDFCVEALNGEPGIRAGEFLKNFGRAEILKRMSGIKIVRQLSALVSPMRHQKAQVKFFSIELREKSQIKKGLVISQIGSRQQQKILLVVDITRFFFRMVGTKHLRKSVQRKQFRGRIESEILLMY